MSSCLREAFVIAALAASAVTADAEPKRSSRDTVLRGVDWCNRGYGEGKPVLLDCHGGVEQRHRAGEGIWGVEEYRLKGVYYGDLTGDQREDALLVVETTLRPVVISASPPTPRAEVWLIERRGADLFTYTNDSADRLPTSVTIEHGTAVLVWLDKGKRCEQRLRFAGEGETAVKSAPVCTRP